MTIELTKTEKEWLLGDILFRELDPKNDYSSEKDIRMMKNFKRKLEKKQPNYKAMFRDAIQELRKTLGDAECVMYLHQKGVSKYEIQSYF